MTEFALVKQALSPFCSLHELDDHVAVSTHCLYPSGATVTVYVIGGAKESIISDEGGAIDELATHNRFVADADKYLHRFCRRYGVKHENGKIYIRISSNEQLVSAIVRVANASMSAATWGFENIKLIHKRDLRRELHGLIEKTFPKERILAEVRLHGRSSRQYTFDRLIRLSKDTHLVIDPVLRDNNSINSRAIAHLDLKQLESEDLIQRITYDDQEEWDSADLNLLQMAATLVPFSQLEDHISGISRGFHGE